jgi:hypothetical protein
MKKEILEGETPSRRRGSKTGSRKAGQIDRKNSAKRAAGETILDDDVQIPDVDPEDEDIELTEEIDSDELSDILEDLEQEDTDDIASHLVKDEEDEESRNTRGLMKYSEHRPSRPKSSKIKREAKEDVSEDIEEKPRTRWFMTTCLYCGNIYRFRSDQIQPPTCGNPQCVARFEERMKKKAAVAVA